MKMITFLTDFGRKSSYVAQMKGVASSLSDARLIDITHDVQPHNIREAAFSLKNVVDYFPDGTVHVVVIDPGVGTDRKGLVITTKSQILVGPDNGVLIPAAKHLGDFTVYDITNTRFMLKKISNTFHGRDIFTPVAAYITKNIKFKNIGSQTKEFVDLEFPSPIIKEGKIYGEILYVDDFGNLITNIENGVAEKYFSYGKKIKVDLKDKTFFVSFERTYGKVNVYDLVLLKGSQGFLEVSVNQGSASADLGIKSGGQISFSII
ncbi:MAG: S-adenosyl-l-methionine hydroxide adenosyltransferase family protein [Candidatus Thermoplasmatota archaeon]